MHRKDRLLLYSTKPQMHHKGKATRRKSSIFHLTKDNY